MAIIYDDIGAMGDTRQAVYYVGSSTEYAAGSTLMFPGPGDTLFEMAMGAVVIPPGAAVVRGAPTYDNKETFKVKLGFSWTCAYCGQCNAAEREGCRGCGAPKPGVT